MSHLGIVFQNDERKRTFFLVIFREGIEGSCQKGVISYMLSYLIDKKQYRKRKNFVERIAGLKSICIFVAEK